MKKGNEYHIPALLKEALFFLKVIPEGKYIDATLGGGGHSREIVCQGGELLAIDRDPQAIEYGGKRLLEACPAHQPPKVVLGNFSEIDKIAVENGFDKVDGILFDLGVSSHQLETAERGFSFSQKGPLDMRMDPSLTVTAKDLVNGLNEKELEELISKLGEESFARRYAKAICEARKEKPLETCEDLANVILAVTPRGRFERTHPATKTFQALRIAVNDELNVLKEALPKSVNLLKNGGRLVVISFHSLEDGIVKRFFKEMEESKTLKVVTEKPIAPTREETLQNPRSRSAKLRAAEKI